MNNTRIYNANTLNICGISDDKTDCSRQNAFCDGTNYANLPLGCVCEGTVSDFSSFTYTPEW